MVPVNVLATLIRLALFPPTQADSVEIYSAILRQVEAEYPGQRVVLAETRSGVRCMPVCGVALHDPEGSPVPSAPTPEVSHSPGLLRELRDRGLIDATCAVQERFFGCEGYSGHLFVALGQIEHTPRFGPVPVDRGLWVQTAFLVPCASAVRDVPSGKSCHPEMFGYWYLLVPSENGTWTVARRHPGFTAV